MTYGSTGKLLRVNLSTSSIQVEEFSEDFYRLYPGGKALAGYILLHELPPHTDPLAPENVLVMATGLLTGAALTQTSRFVVSARSPLTQGYGESEAGGYWGPELKMAGFDAIVVTGRAPEPVYLWIQDGQVEIRSAKQWWGRPPVEVQAGLRAELGDEKIRVLQIGLGGENCVRYACLTNELRHFNGRTGMGAVMGSKNLKAVAVRGHQRYTALAHDAQALSALARKLAPMVQTYPPSLDLQKRGTHGLVESLNAGGMLPTLNFRRGAFDKVDNLKWEAYEKQIFTRAWACYACAVHCKREIAIEGRPSPYGGPEYESVAALGSCCGVDDLVTVAKANELCNEHTLDAISTGATLAFAMECFEQGLISLKDTDGIELRFGNAAALLPMIEKIARREGIGNLLAEGSRHAAEVIGGGAHRYAVQVKGQAPAMHDPRGKYNVGIGYAVSEIGADHLVVTHDPTLSNPEAQSFKNAQPLGIAQAQPVLSLSDEKMNHFYILERWISLGKALGWCYFGPAPRSSVPVPDMLGVVQAATGWDFSLEEALRTGERATNMARVFNVREGFSRQDDMLPERFFEPLENGALAGQVYPRDDFERALTQLYTLKGWAPDTGRPLRSRLEALSLGWAADLLEAMPEK
jgi:aldehyde:ferredoxin oxidoreductase